MNLALDSAHPLEREYLDKKDTSAPVPVVGRVTFHLDLARFLHTELCKQAASALTYPVARLGLHLRALVSANT